MGSPSRSANRLISAMRSWLFGVVVQLLEVETWALSACFPGLRRIAYEHHVQRDPVVGRIEHLLGDGRVEGAHASAEPLVVAGEQGLADGDAAVSGSGDRIGGALSHGLEDLGIDELVDEFP